MKDWLKKEIKKSNIWCKKIISIILCIVIVIVSMPSTVSGATYYNARLLREERLLGKNLLNNAEETENSEILSSPDINAEDESGGNASEKESEVPNETTKETTAQTETEETKETPTQTETEETKETPTQTETETETEVEVENPIVIVGTNEAVIKVTGISKTLTITFTNVNDKSVVTADHKGNGVYYAELQKMETYEVSYGKMTGYYVSKIKTASDESDPENRNGGSFRFTYTGEAAEFIFSTVPKIYKEENKDITLVSENVYDLSENYGITDFAAYNDGGAFTLSYANGIRFMQNTTNLVVNESNKIKIVTSEDYQMVVNYVSTSSGSVQLNLDGAVIGNAASGIYNTITYDMLLSAGTHTLGGNGNVGIVSITLYKLEEKTYTVNLQGGTTPNDTELSFENNLYGITRTALVTNGKLQVKLLATTKGMDYEVTKIAGTGVDFIEARNEVTVNRNSSEINSLEIESSSLIKITFAEEDTEGNPFDSSAITAVNVSHNKTTTSYPKVDDKFAPNLIVGYKYSFSAEGVSAYTVHHLNVTIDGNKTENIEMPYTYLGTESEIELVFTPKENIKVYFDITQEDEAALLDAGLKLEDFKFTFTASDNSGIEYNDIVPQKEANAYYVEIISGTYNVTVSSEELTNYACGTKLDTIPYELSSTTLSVAEDGDKFYLEFSRVKDWYFYNDGTHEYYSSELNKKQGYYKGIKIDASAGKFDYRGDNSKPNEDTQLNANTYLHIPVPGACTLTLILQSAAANEIKSDTNDTIVTVIDADNKNVKIEYTGAAGEVVIYHERSSSINIKSLSLVEAEISEEKKDPLPDNGTGPFIAADDGDIGTATADTDQNPRRSKKDTVSVADNGQRLTISQTNPDHIDSFIGTTYDSTMPVGYYVFPKTTDYQTLTFDMKVNSYENNNGGIYVGVFSDDYMYTTGFRGNKSIQKVYSSDSMASGKKYASNSSTGASSFEIGEKFKVKITRTNDTTFTVDAQSYTDENHVVSYDYKVKDDAQTAFYYGFLMDKSSVEVTNLLLTKKVNGTTSTVYNQNDYYYPYGSYPKPRALYATSTQVNGKTVVKLSIMGDEPAEDGFYVLQRAIEPDDGSEIDESEWTTIEDSLCDTTYIDESIAPKSIIHYIYRVKGQLGRKSLGGNENQCSAWITSKSVDYEGTLGQAQVTVTSNQTGITLTWDEVVGAEYYTIYRFAYGDTFEDVQSHIIKRKETGLTYTDNVSSKADSIVQDDPYYYYVKAVSQDNESLFSEDYIVWGVAASNRSGYDYEANEIFITNRSYETVFDGEILLEGLVNGSSGTIALYVNGSQKASKNISDREEFSFTTTINPGRNDVYLLFTSNSGTQAKKSFNYVYATDFDAIVDASFKGTDGSASNIVKGASIPTYKTITEALKHANGTDRYIVLILEGEYEERLVVTTPNVTLLGEDMEKTLIHYYPGNVGGNMEDRCATYIKSSAVNSHAENLTFKNDYAYTGKANPNGGSNESADALRCDADGAQFIHCTLDGMQDTLYMHAGMQYYEKCYINGIVDYIYCNFDAKAFFNECILTFQAGSAKTSGYVVAPRTGEDNNFGMVFYKCAVLAESGCTTSASCLARPWGAGGMAVWIECFMGRSIKSAAPYASMSGVTPQEARFYEWYSYGSGYEINNDRPQISKAKANEFYAEGKKSYHHDYKGNLKTTRDKKYISSEFASDEYSWTDGDDSKMGDYFMEGYAVEYGVSGGGLLKETSSNYYAVSSADEFLQALTDIKSKNTPSVIELKSDINLGCNEVDISKYSSIIKPYSAQPLTHPTLLKTGVSVLTINKMNNITIFSSNASAIKHANIDIKASSNIMIRNIVFDELWEWDEDTSGDYDRNDWDYMTIEKSDGVWIDHCTFYKVYDGVVDIKNANPTERVTISWCQFRPGSRGDTFFNTMMDYIENNPSKFPTTYQKMLDAGMTQEQIRMYAYGQKKTHLFGQSDSATDAVGIKATLANNYYYDSMDRMPRLRYGVSHVYNCIMDSQGLLTMKKNITDSAMRSKFVSNGAASTCGGQILLEDCYISGIENALNSGNGSSPSGYINAINSVYYMNGTRAELAVKNNTKADDLVLVTDANAFRKNLTYEYSLKNAINLFSTVLPYAGVGSITLTTLQWEKTDYNVAKTESEKSSVSDAPTSSEDIPNYKDYDTDIKGEEIGGGADKDTEIEEPETEATLIVPEIMDNSDEGDNYDSSNEDKQEVEKEEIETETAPEEPKKQGDVIMINGKAYTIADINGKIAYRVSYAIPESVLTPAVKSAIGVNSVNELISYLKNDIVKAAGTHFSSIQSADLNHTAIYDLSILILQSNGEWIEVTKDNFPAAGLDVLIPYPNNTGASTHRFGVSHLIVLGCNGKAPGTIEYLTPTAMGDGLKVHVLCASPFTVIYEAIGAASAKDTTKQEESAGSKWIAAKNTMTTAEEEAASRARNAEASTRQTLDSVMGSGYLVWVTFVSIVIMGGWNYLYYRYKRKQEIDTGICYGDSMSII